jgi:DNA polymerase-4
MDAFFASCEQARKPYLKGKPVVVGSGARSVVSASSYEARRFGVYSAMPVFRAKELCPQATFLPVDMNYYMKMSERVFAIFENYSPFVEHISIDEAYIDVSGAKRHFGDELTIANLIRAEVEEKLGVTCSVGIGKSKSVAKLASKHAKPNGVLLVYPENTLDFLEDLPVKELWGVGRKTLEALQRYDIKTVGELARFDKKKLIGLLGDAAGNHLWNVANGIDEREIEKPQPQKSMSKSMTLERDTNNLDTLTSVLRALANKLGLRAHKNKMEVKKVSVMLKFTDKRQVSFTKKLQFPTSDSRKILSTADELFQDNYNDEMVRLVGVAVD